MHFNVLSVSSIPTITRSRFGTSHEGFSPSWDVWYDSWEVVPPREASGGFDFSRGKNQTKVTSHEEQHLTRDNTKLYHISRVLKPIPSWHLTREHNHTISTSHECQNHTISTSHEGCKPYHLDISRGIKPYHLYISRGIKPYHLYISRGIKPNYTTSHEGSNHTILTSHEGSNQTIFTSHEGSNHTILTSHEGSKPSHLDISRGWNQTILRLTRDRDQTILTSHEGFEVWFHSLVRYLPIHTQL